MYGLRTHNLGRGLYGFDPEILPLCSHSTKPYGSYDYMNFNQQLINWELLKKQTTSLSEHTIHFENEWFFLVDAPNIS